MLAGPSNSGSSGHPKIQTESKDDILFLKKELESAGQMALADMSDSKATIGSPMEAQVQECINQVFILKLESLENQEFKCWRAHLSLSGLTLSLTSPETISKSMDLTTRRPLRRSKVCSHNCINSLQYNKEFNSRI